MMQTMLGEFGGFSVLKKVWPGSPLIQFLPVMTSWTTGSQVELQVVSFAGTRRCVNDCDAVE